MPAIPNSYTSSEALEGMYGRSFSEKVPTLAQATAIAQQVAQEIDAVAGVWYMLPITRAANPLAYDRLAYGNALGTLYHLHNLEYSIARQPGSNPWATAWKDWLAGLGRSSLADAAPRSRVTVEGWSARVEAWARAFFAEHAEANPADVNAAVAAIRAALHAWVFQDGDRIPYTAIDNDDNHFALSEDLISYDDIRGLIRRWMGITAGALDSLPDRDGADGQVWTFRNGGVDWEAAQGGSGGGLTEAQVDARVRALDRGIQYVGDARPAPAAYHEGDLAFYNQALWELVEASEATATLPAVAWTPTKSAGEEVYGFDLRTGERQFGSRPTGWPTSILSLFRDNNNNIWLYASPDTFGQSHTDAIDVEVDGLTFHLPFDRTAFGYDHYMLPSQSRAPWSASQIQIGIHAVGGEQPFTSATKDWSKVADLAPYRLPGPLSDLVRNIMASGWQVEMGLDHTAPQAAAYTEATAKAAEYVTLTQTSTTQNNRNIAVRVPKTLFDSQPPLNALAQRVQMRTGDTPEADVIGLADATYLGDDNTYWYYNLPITRIPAASRLQLEYDHPTELDNIDIPVAAIEGLAEFIRTEIGDVGLSESAVDARVVAGVKPKALKDAPLWTTPADYVLPKVLGSLERQIDEGGWEVRTGQTQVAAIVTGIYQQVNTVFGLTYADTAPPIGARPDATRYQYFRIADALDSSPDLDEYQLKFGDGDEALTRPVSTATQVLGGGGQTVIGGFRYYYLELAADTIPAGSTIRLEYDEPFRIEAEAVKPKAGDLRYDDDSPSDIERWTGSAWTDVPATGGALTAGVITVHSGPINSPNLTAFNSARAGGHTKFSPDFNLDEHPSGFLEMELDISIANHAFTSAGHGAWVLSLAPDAVATQASVTGLQALSVIAATDDFVAGGTHEGAVAMRQPLYAGPGAGSLRKVGDFVFRTSHDGDNDLFYDWDYEEDASGPTVTGTAEFTSTLNAAAQKSDAPASSGGGDSTATGTPPLIGTSSAIAFTADNSYLDTGIDMPADYATTIFKIRFEQTGGIETQMLEFYGGALSSNGSVGGAVTGTDLSVGLRSARGNDNYFLAVNASRRLFVARLNGATSNLLEIQVWRVAAGGGGGLTQSQADGRIRALVSDFAEEGNNTPLPRAKGSLVAPVAVPLVQASNRVYANNQTAGNIASQSVFTVAAGDTVRIEATAMLEMADNAMATNLTLSYSLPGDTTDTVAHTTSGQTRIAAGQADVRFVPLEAAVIVPSGQGGSMTVKLGVMSSSSAHSILDRTLKCTVFK